MVVLGFLLNKYAPSDPPQLLSSMPHDYLKLFPIFNGEDEISTQRHINIFYAFADNLNVEHLDVALRLVVKSLNGEAKKWFKTLPNASISTWEELENSFTHRCGEKRDHEYILTEFISILKKPNEYILEFIKRFNNKYKKTPIEINPPQVIA